MPKLNNTQTILLSTASQRDNRSLHPLPATHANGGVRVARAIAALIKAGFAEDRAEGAIFATPAGLAAIGVETVVGSTPEEAEVSVSPHRKTKSTTVVALLRREAGATLPDLINATGWLPHTTRAALTGLRKKGHVIERFRRDEVTCYRITGEAAA